MVVAVYLKVTLSAIHACEMFHICLKSAQSSEFCAMVCYFLNQTLLV